MKLRHIFLSVLAVSAAIARYISSPFPSGSENPVVALMALNAPVLLWLAHGWYALMPGVAVFIGGTLFSGVWPCLVRVRPHGRNRARAGCPPWPIAPSDEKPAIVVGETHHPVEAREVPNPEWLVIPERGLYTGVAIFGAVGSGKTSACMHPFARQLLGWQAWNPERRAAALILEVKGDFCYDIREILKAAKREEDYMEIGMDGKYQWNPLAAHWLDSYSLGLYRVLAPESVVRQRERPVLADGLHESGEVDYRAVPDLSRPLGDLAGCLPVRDRPRTVQAKAR